MEQQNYTRGAEGRGGGRSCAGRKGDARSWRQAATFGDDEQEEGAWSLTR